MPKRSAEEKIKYYNAKIKKLKNKSDKKHRRVIVYTSSDSEENGENGTQHNDAPLSAPPSPLVAPLQTTSPPPPASPSPLVPPDEILPPSHDANNEPMPELDSELLQALGEACDDVPIYGPDIHDKLAQRWLPILKKGLQLDAKEKLLKQYNVPENCKLLKAPTLNPEISSAVADIARARDKKILAKQDQLGLGITAVNRAMTLLLTGEDKVQAIKILSDGCRILTDLHFIETQVRTKLLTPGLEKSFLTLIQDQTRDETLFGSTLGEKIKASKAIERQGQQIKKPMPKPTTSSASSSTTRPRPQGNWGGPPRYQSSYRGGRTTPYRTPYRRAPPATLPPSTRPSTSTSTTSNKRAPTRQ